MSVDTQSRIITIATVISAASLAVIAAAVATLAIDVTLAIGDSKSPWSAPWVNVISGDERLSWDQAPATDPAPAPEAQP